MVENDPWGKLYKVVLEKLHGPSATTAMELRVVRDIASALFLYCPPKITLDFGQWPVDVPEYSHTEVKVTVRRLRSRNRAPGPNGISSRV